MAATSNIENDEEKVGFEWRRTDWTDDFKSNEETAYLFEGTMEGYIRNLNTDKLWKVRPYYESAKGNRYYGEQQTFRTGTDASGIESAGSADSTSTETARYDLRGHRLTVPRRGLNILRMSDGKVRKMMVR